MTDLGVPSDVFSQGRGINDTGQITGTTDDFGHGNPNAFLYSNGAVVEIGSFWGFESFGNAINNDGQVTGGALTPFPNPELHTFLYSDGGLADLGTLGGRISMGNAINNKGQIVGVADVSNAFHAFLYTNGTMIDLDTLLPADSRWLLEHASDVNDSGQIVGDGLIDGERHAFLLSDLPPIPIPASWVMLFSGLSYIGALSVFARRRSDGDEGAATSV